MVCGWKSRVGSRKPEASSVVVVLIKALCSDDNQRCINQKDGILEGPRLCVVTTLEAERIWEASLCLREPWFLFR